jgi:hypothetical protein
MRRFNNGIIMRGLLIAGCFLALTVGAEAQRWEKGYGDPVKLETARNGVQPVIEGGYVTVGDTKNAATPGAGDIFVVRTDNHGIVAWERAYDIGLNDVATDIAEIPGGGTGTNGFIITGYTNHGAAGDMCNTTTYDVFLLRIDRCGNIVWRRTYGDIQKDEYGWDVIRATTGNGVTTFPGDFIVAGWQGNTPTRDGYLLRVTAAGVPIWGTLYRGPVNDLDDYFYALDEATIVNAGEIIAAGGTTSYSGGNLDGWIVRVNGNTGAVANGASHGDAVATQEFRSVQELKIGSNLGHIVAVGRTTSLAQDIDVYLLETDAVLVRQADVVLGFCSPDEGFYVREIPGAPNNVPSNVIITGYLTPQPGWGHGAEDAFLQVFVTGNLDPSGNTFVYGNGSNDRGWSVEPVRAAANCVTAGFIVAGSIAKPVVAPADLLQLYMFKTNTARSSGCELTFTPPTRIPVFPRIALNPLTANLTVNCIPPIAPIVLAWEQTICALILDNTMNCPNPNCQGGADEMPNAEHDLSEQRIDGVRNMVNR